MLSFAGVFMEAGVKLTTTGIIQSYMYCLPIFRGLPFVFCFFFPPINLLKLSQNTQSTSVFSTLIVIHQAFGAF